MNIADATKVLSPETKKIDNCAHLKECRLVLKNIQIKKEKITRSKYCHISDCIIGHLLFDNGTRPGVISNMTVMDNEKAQFMDGTYAIPLLLLTTRQMTTVSKDIISSVTL